MILLIDDRPEFHEQFAKQFQLLKISLELICFSKVEDLKEHISHLKESGEISKLKSLIIDLSNTKDEEISKSFSVKNIIEDSYYNNSIPIFIHSGYLNYYSDFDDKGSIIKVKKNIDSVNSICKMLKSMIDSGFLDIFCINGILQQNFFKELHDAFTEQFKGNEIIKIINSIEHSHPGDIKVSKERTIDTFRRIAIRSVYQNLLSAKKSVETDTIKEVHINAVENYYRRTSEFKYWTGDIFKENNSNENVVVLTPRCNISNDKFFELLICKLKPLSGEYLTAFKKEANLKKGLTDDVTLIHIAERYRFLVPTPQFEGGIIDFNFCFTKERETFLKDYTYAISLVDDLTNDMVRKFTAYLSRGGVSVTELKEALFYISEVD